MPGLKEQEEENVRVQQEVARRFSSVSINAARSLGDAKRDQTALLALQHREALESAVAETNWSQFGVGKFPFSFIQEHLGLEMSPAELLATGDPARFEKLKEAIATLDGLLGDSGIIGAWRTIVAGSRDELVAEESKFAESQVDVDVMDHSGFHKTVAVMRQCVLASVESIVDGLDTRTAQLREEYHGVLAKQLAAYGHDAAIVAAASPARLRGTKAEDDEEPWQVPEEKRVIKFESPHLQRLLHQEAISRVSDEPEEEWYLQRRRDVANLVHKARRVAVEVDAEDFDLLLRIIDEMAALSDQKISKVQDTMTSNASEAERVLLELAEGIQEIEAAGLAFMERKRSAREAAQRDLERVARYREKETAIDAACVAEHEAVRAKHFQRLKDNEGVVEQKLAMIVALQEEVVELANQRKYVQEELLDAVNKEGKRRSEFVEMRKACEEYTEVLERTMKNFLLPEGYSGILAKFARLCEAQAKAKFDGHAHTLAALHEATVAENVRTLATGDLIPRFTARRLREKAKDLEVKANLARRQLELCKQTKDPKTGEYEGMETEILAIREAILQKLPPLNECHDRYAARHQASLQLLGKIPTLTPPLGGMSLDEVFVRNVEAHNNYILMGCRPPLVNLHFDELDRLSVPSAYVAPELVQRAVAAEGHKRQFGRLDGGGFDVPSPSGKGYGPA